MKKNRKLTALLVAACMTIPMAATTFTVPMVASGATVTITNNDNKQAEFYGFKVFEGIYDDKNTPTDSDDTFSVTGWGANFNHIAFITALKSDPTLSALFDGEIDDNWDDAKKAAKVAEIASSFKDDEAKSEAFARLAGANVKMIQGDSHNSVYANADIKGSDTGNVIMKKKDSDNDTNIDPGYYVIIEAYGPNNSARTLGLLKVVGADESINTKRSDPTITKKVKEGDEWKLVADACIGDEIDFQITVKLPDRLDSYNAYYCVIKDTLDENFSDISDIAVQVGNNLSITESDNNCRINSSGNNIEISFENVKAYSNVTNDTLITVTYTAKLNQTAIIGEEGQKNLATLKYLANPNIVYNPSTTDQNVDKPNEKDSGGHEDNMRTTTTAQVKVLTYELDIEKIDAQFNETKLNNAEFTLQNSENKFLAVQAIDSSNEHIYTVVGWVDSKGYSNDGATTTLTSKNSGKINIVGLDSGTYTLTETNAPTGYNILQNPITVTIESVKQEVILDPIDNSAQNLTVKVDSEAAVEGLKTNENYTGVLQIQVANNKGTTLPETGGIGTKIFYVLGGTLVIGSGAALVIKKRMGKDEE